MVPVTLLFTGTREIFTGKNRHISSGGSGYRNKTATQSRPRMFPFVSHSTPDSKSSAVVPGVKHQCYICIGTKLPLKAGQECFPSSAVQRPIANPLLLYLEWHIHLLLIQGQTATPMSYQQATNFSLRLPLKTGTRVSAGGMGKCLRQRGSGLRGCGFKFWLVQ